MRMRLGRTEPGPSRPRARHARRWSAKSQESGTERPSTGPCPERLADPHAPMAKRGGDGDLVEPRCYAFWASIRRPIVNHDAIH